jgi:hypothetical protein
MSFGLESFKSSRLGQLIEPIITDAQNVGDMMAHSRREYPAVEVLGKQLLRLKRVDVRRDYSKQMIGRWVKEVMANHGWEPWKAARVPPGNLFSTGMIYKKKRNDKNG